MDLFSTFFLPFNIIFKDVGNMIALHFFRCLLDVFVYYKLLPFCYARFFNCHANLIYIYIMKFSVTVLKAAYVGQIFLWLLL